MLRFNSRNVFHKEVLQLYVISYFRSLNRKINMESKVEEKSLTDSETSSNILVEGKAKILIPPSKNVFYNPVQEFNRDMRYLSKQ